MEPIQRKCPACQVSLVKEDYESVWALRCPSCRGALISRERLARTERDPAKPLQVLQAEARAEHAGDQEGPVACPRCHSVMKKQSRKRGAASLHFDFCPACDLYWLDGGELALAQLLYETSPQGREARALQQRAQEAHLSPERQARLQAALDRLPDDEQPDDELVNAVGRSVLGSVIRTLLR